MHFITYTHSCNVSLQCLYMCLWWQLSQMCFDVKYMCYLNWALTVYTGLIIVAKLYVAFILIWYICMCIRHSNYFERKQNKWINISTRWAIPSVQANNFPDNQKSPTYYSNQWPTLTFTTPAPSFPFPGPCKSVQKMSFPLLKQIWTLSIQPRQICSKLHISIEFVYRNFRISFLFTDPKCCVLTSVSKSPNDTE